MLRIVPLLYPVSTAHTSFYRVDAHSTSYPFLACFWAPFALPLPPVCPLPADPSVPFPYHSAPSSRRGGTNDWPQSVTHPAVFPTSPSVPTAPTTPATTPAAPITYTSLPDFSRPVLEESGAHPLVPASRRACFGASGRSPGFRVYDLRFTVYGVRFTV